MTIETIKMLRGFDATGDGKMVGEGSFASGGGSGGSGYIISSAEGWDSVIGMNCKLLALAGTARPFGVNGLSNFEQNRNQDHIGALFPPFGNGTRIKRIREIFHFRCVQGDVTFPPLSRCFYGWFQSFSGTDLDYDRGWVGFYTGWLGTTPDTWYCKIVDDQYNIRLSFDTGILTDAPHMLRVDVDPIEVEIRFYIDEVLVQTYVPTSGFFNRLASQDPGYGWGMNAGWTTGSVTETHTECRTNVMSDWATTLSMETP